MASRTVIKIKVISGRSQKLARRTSDHLRSHLSVFKAEYPIQKGYIARLLIVDGRSASDVLGEVRSIVHAAEPEKQLYEDSVTANVYALNTLITAKINFLTEEWPSLIRLFLQPFPLTFMKIPVVPASLQPEHKQCHRMELSETSTWDTNPTRNTDIDRTVPEIIQLDHDYDVKRGKAACDKDEEVDTLEDISLDSETSGRRDNVSSNHPSHNTHTCADVDVEENRTVVYNSHHCVCVRETDLSHRTSNHQVITSENINEEMCYTEDVRSGEGKNKQTQKEATESVTVLDFQAMMAGVKDGCKDLHEGNNILLEQGLSACENIPQPTEGNPYKCDVCGQRFSISSSLNSHKRIHAENNVHKCDVCGKSYKENYYLKTCKMIYTGEKRHKCDVCGFCFRKPSYLNAHKRIHTGEKPYKCDVCGKFIRYLWSLKLHKSIHTGEKPYKCDLCPVAFRYLCTLKSHKMTHTGEKPYKCDICGKGFLQPANLKSHKRTHTGEKPYKCDICGKGFPQLANLKSHKMTHTGEKPYICDVCGLCFRNVSSLNAHKTIHTGEKPYKCDVCGKHFRISTCLTNHKKIHGDRPYKCDVCGKTFLHCTHLKLHKMIHTGEKPYLCDVCGVAFIRLSDLNIHKMRHYLNKDKMRRTGEKPYTCNICGVAYTYLGRLNTHKMRHTGAKPYKCDVCGVAYKYLESLNTHSMSHTGKKLYICDVCKKGFTTISVLNRHKRLHGKTPVLHSGGCRP